MKRKLVFQVVPCLLGIWLFMGPMGMVEAAPPFKIGFVDGLSGPYAHYAADTRAGIEIAIEEINDKGGIQGRRFELLMRDDKLSPEAALRGAKDLVLTEKVDYLMGTTSSACALAVSGFAKEQKIPFNVTIAQSEHITGKHGHRYIFRSTTNTHLYSYADARGAAKLPITKWWLLNPDYEYGHACYNQFKKMLKDMKPTVEFAGEGWPKLGEPDYSPFLTPIMASGAKGLFTTVAGGDFIKLVKSGRGLGLFQKITVVGHDLGCINTYYALGKDMPDGIWGGTQYQFWTYKDNPRSEKFYHSVMKKINRPPGLGAPSGYEGTWAIARAAEKAGSTDIEKIIDALEGMKLDTVVGPVTMRKVDHQAMWPFWFGRTKMTPDYAFPILVDTFRVQEEAYPQEGEILKARGQTK